MPTRSIIVTLNVLCCLVTSKGYFFPQSKADLQPVDPLVFVGETLKVQCRLIDSTIQATSHDMYFAMASHYVSSNWTVILENITIVDNKTISAYVNVTEAFSNTTTVFCKYKNMTQDVDLKSGYIHVEKPIRNITNFSAVYYYFGNLELSWSLGESYLSEQGINVTVDWSANAPPDKQGSSCEKQTAESCIILPTGQDFIFVRINVTSTMYKRPSSEFLQPLFNKSVTSVIKIRVDNHTKTQPPGNLREIGKNSTCANLTWDDPLYIADSKLEPRYEVTITRKDGIPTNIKQLGVRPVGQNYITVCSLRPFTTHIMSVRIKGKEVNPWSDPAFTEVTTTEDRPLTGPPLNSTSYHSDDCVDNEMFVTVFWNDPLKSSLRGELTQFEFVVDNVSALLRKGSNYHKTKLSCGAEHEVLVYSVTKIGNSLAPSDISIPKKSAELPALNEVTVRMDEVQESSHTDKLVNVTVAWDPGPLAERNVTLVLYMCQESSDPFTCLNDFSTREFSVDKKEVLLSDLWASVNLFGYALIDDQGHKRGIEWISCVYRAKQVPNRPAPVKVNTGKEANTLDISWTSARCDRKTKVLILRYYLFICGQRNQNYKLCPNRTFSSSRSSYTARDLVGGSNYSVYIEAESPAGLSLASKPTSGVAGVSHSDYATMSIIMGLLSAVIFAGILIICFVRKCKHSKKKITSLAKNKCQIFEYVKELQPQPSQDSGIDTDRSQALTADVPLEKPLVPPVTSSKSDIDLIRQICSQYTQSINTRNEMACDSKVDNTEDHIPNTVTPIHTTIPILTSVQDVMDDLQMPHPPGKEHEYLHSGSGNPYVKMANACFSSGSDASTVAVDEGYNSPDFDIDTPVFSADRQRTMLADRVPASPVCRNGFVPSFSPSPQIVFRCMNSSLISCQAEKILPEPNVSFIPSHSRRTWQEPDVIMNSPHCQIIPETHLSMKSPQSQISETHLSMKSPQSQISEIHLSMKTPQSQMVLPTASTSAVSQQSLNKHGETALSPQPMVTMNNSLIQVYNVSGPTQHGSLPAVNFQGNNASPTSIDKCSQVELCNRSNRTSINSTEVCDMTESSDLCRGDNSNHHMVSGYVTCGIDGAMNFKTVEVSEPESTDSGNVFSQYKPNCLTSQNMAIPEGSQNVISGYKSLEFLENSQMLGLINQSGFGTQGEDFIDEGGFGTDAPEYVGQGGVDDLGRFVGHGELDVQSRFGTCKENLDNQGRLPVCVLSVYGGGTDELDSYVTCNIADEVKYEEVGCALEQESAASLNRFSSYTPNCQTDINRKDAENESDRHVSQSSEIGHISTIVADDEGNASGGYRGFGFLENAHGLDFGDQEEFEVKKKDCVQQAGFGIQNEECVRQADFGIQNGDYVRQADFGIQNEDYVTQADFGIQNEDYVTQADFGIQNEDYVTQADFGIQNEDYVTQADFGIQNEDYVTQADFGIQNEDYVTQADFGIRKVDHTRQADFGIQSEDFGHQDKLNMLNVKIVNRGSLPVEENNEDFTGEVDGQTFDYVRQQFTDKNLNPSVDNFMLKSAHVGNNLKLMEAIPEQSTFKNISCERNDLNNTSADATVDLSICDGGYVSHFQFSTQAHPVDSNSHALLDTGCRRQTEESSQVTQNPDIESSHPDNDFGYVSVNFLAGEVML